MRTLTLHTADELVKRWRKRAFELNALANERVPVDFIARHLSGLDRERAQSYRVCAMELAAILAASMEMEAAHHGDPEPRVNKCDDPDCSICGETDEANALREWLAGERP